jgi:hypothetical protein
MPELYLTPASISYLTQFLLTLIITIYLGGVHLRRGSPVARRQGLMLFIFFASLTLLTLLFFLEYCLMPSDRMASTWLESAVLAVLLTALIHFAYHFPAPNDKQKIERWIIYILSSGYIVWELSFAIHRILLLPAGIVIYRLPEMDKAMVAEFVWIIFVFARSFIRNWKLPVVRNFVFILLIPLGLAILEIPRGVDATITYLYPILSSIGLLFTTFFFALNYLTSQPEQISFVAKISGVVLTSVLAVFGSIAWLVTPAYAAGYVPSVLSLDHRTIHFSPNGQGGYQAVEIPFHWEENLGQMAELSSYEAVQEYSFNFPFWGQTYKDLQQD